MRPSPETGDRWAKQARHTLQMKRLRMRDEELASGSACKAFRTRRRDGLTTTAIMRPNRNLTSVMRVEPKPHICNAGEPKPHICNKGEPKPHICNGANRNLTSVMGVNRNLTSVMGQTETSHLKWRTPEPHICTLLILELP